MDAAALPAEPAALGARHAAEAQEAAEVPQDAEAQEVAGAPRDAEVLPAEPVAALRDAELEAAVPSDAVELAEPAARPWLAADHPSAALPFPFRAPWLLLPAAVARPRWVRFAHARRSLQTATQ